MEFLLVLAVVCVAVLIVVGPLRPGVAGRAVAEEEAVRADLEAAKEVKLREIRELELDFRTGKLSEADFHAQNRLLRAEAVQLLKRLDQFSVADADPQPEVEVEQREPAPAAEVAPPS